MKDFAIKLYRMQAAENDGRGIECVRQMCAGIHMNKPEDARTIFKTDGDKITQYPEIYHFIEQNLGCRLHGTLNCPRCMED